MFHDNTNIDDLYTVLLDKINCATNTYIPRKTVTIHPDDKPWMTGEIRFKLRQKNRQHKKAKLKKREQDWAHFRTIRNEIIELIRQAKDNHLKKLQNSLVDKSVHPRKWWSIAKSIAQINNTNTNSSPLKHNNKILIHPLDKAEALNNFFTSIASDITDSNLPDQPPLCPFELSEINITEQDIQDQFNMLNANKPAGPDGLLPKIIKNMSTSLIYPLTILFNRTLTQSVIPDILKNNYRPIAITSTFIKC